MKNHTVIVGAGKSGLAVARHLAMSGSPFTITDSGPCPSADLAAQLASWGARCAWGGHPDSLLDNASEVVLSPVVKPKVGFALEAAKRGIPVIGELEFAHRAMRKKDPTAMILAVTGTNGKSTTTDLAAHLLRAGGQSSVACGNLGLPFMDAVDGAEAGTRFVVECSSYQLETIAGFRAEAAAILNLSPDHLARHGTMEAYLAAKCRIFERQGPSDLCVSPVGANFTVTRSQEARAALFGRIQGENPSQIAYGAWAGPDGKLFLRDENGRETQLIHSSELLIPGWHNVENALAAALLALHGGAAIEGVRDGLRDYPGLAHRLSFCGERNGVKAYNDSKATNVDSTLTAIRALPGPLVLILGGEDKGSSYGPLRSALEGKLRRLVFLGDAIPMLERDLGDLPHTTIKGFDEAARKAFAIAEPGDQVLLSPACASFDQFKNFEERGRRFEELVGEIGFRG